MHKISRKTVQDLAAELVELCIHADTDTIKHKAMQILELSVLLDYEKDIEPLEELSEVTNEAEEQSFFEPFVDEETSEVIDSVEEDKIQSTLFDDSEFKVEKPSKKLPKINIEEEFKDSIHADIAADLFERAEKIQSTKKSLNEKLSQSQIQIGLNDRIAFVKHLFEGNIEDFNRVLSQLNSFDNEEDAKNFIENHVQPDYNWEAQEEYVLRFFKLLEGKFL